MSIILSYQRLTTLYEEEWILHRKRKQTRKRGELVHPKGRRSVPVREGQLLQQKPPGRNSQSEREVVSQLRSQP